MLTIALIRSHNKKPINAWYLQQNVDGACAKFSTLLITFLFIIPSFYLIFRLLFSILLIIFFFAQYLFCPFSCIFKLLLSVNCSLHPFTPCPAPFPSLFKTFLPFLGFNCCLFTHFTFLLPFFRWICRFLLFYFYRFSFTYWLTSFIIISP